MSVDLLHYALPHHQVMIVFNLLFCIESVFVCIICDVTCLGLETGLRDTE